MPPLRTPQRGPVSYDELVRALMQMDLAVGSGAILCVGSGGGADNDPMGVQPAIDIEPMDVQPTIDVDPIRRPICQKLCNILLSFASAQPWSDKEPVATRMLTLVGNAWAYRINQALGLAEPESFQFLAESGGTDGTQTAKFIDIVLKVRGLTAVFIEGKLGKSGKAWDGDLVEIKRRYLNHSSKYEDSIGIAVNLMKTKNPQAPFAIKEYKIVKINGEDAVESENNMQMAQGFQVFDHFDQERNGHQWLGQQINDLRQILIKAVEPLEDHAKRVAQWERDTLLFCRCLSEVQRDLKNVWQHCATCITGNSRLDAEAILAGYNYKDFYELPATDNDTDPLQKKDDRKMQTIRKNSDPELQQCLQYNKKHYRVTIKAAGETIVVNLRALLQSDNQAIKKAIQTMRNNSANVQPVEVSDLKTPPCFDMFYTEWEVGQSIYQIVWPRVLLGRDKIPDKWKEKRAIYYNFDQPDEYTMAGIRRLLSKQDGPVDQYLLNACREAVETLRRVAEQFEEAHAQAEGDPAADQVGIEGENWQKSKRQASQSPDTEHLTHRVVKDIVNEAVVQMMQNLPDYTVIKNEVEQTVARQLQSFRDDLKQQIIQELQGEQPAASSENTAPGSREEWKANVKDLIYESFPEIAQRIKNQISNFVDSEGQPARVPSSQEGIDEDKIRIHTTAEIVGKIRKVLNAKPGTSVAGLDDGEESVIQIPETGGKIIPDRNIVEDGQAFVGLQPAQFVFTLGNSDSGLPELKRLREQYEKENFITGWDVGKVSAEISINHMKTLINYINKEFTGIQNQLDILRNARYTQAHDINSLCTNVIPWAIRGLDKRKELIWRDLEQNTQTINYLVISLTDLNGKVQVLSSALRDDSMEMDGS